MTEPPFRIELAAGTTVKTDGMCPRCQRWTLWRTPVLMVSEHGASEAGQIETCEICDTEENELDNPEEGR